MNNKGLVSFWTAFILILVVMILAMAQNKVDTSTINKAIDIMNWTRIGQNVTESIQRASDGSPNYIVQVTLNIINKAIEFFGYAIFEVGKLAMTLARDNPNIINWKVLFWLIILSLLAPLIYPAFIIIVSLILIIKEWIVNRKEKRKLRELQCQKN